MELCNDEFLRILHAERHEIVGLNMLGYIKDKKVIDAILDALEGKTGVYEGDYISVTSGRKVPLRGIFVGVPAGDGSTTTGIGIVIYTNNKSITV